MANKPLTQDQLAKVEEKLKTYMANKQSWVKRYGKDAENVMRGRAISTVKKETEKMNKQKLKELVKTSLMKEVSNSEIESSVKNMISNSEYDIDDFKISSDNPNKVELRYQYYSRLPEDLRSSLENEFDVVENELEDEDTLPQYSYIISSKMNEGKKEDITGPKGKPDGKIDSKDYLAKRDAAIKKAKGVELDEAEKPSIFVTGGNINPELRKKVEQFVKGVAKYYDYSVDDAYFAIMSILKGGLNKMNENTGLKKGDTVEYEGNKYKIGSFNADTKTNLVYLNTIDGKPAEDSKGDYLQVNATRVKPSMNEDLDLGHQDNEPHMIKGELYRIGKYAMELYQMVDGFEGQGEVDFPAWWQSKITTSMNNMVSAKHYLDFETKEPAIDAMVGVASDEEVIDEKKLTKAETKKKEEIVKGMKDSFKGDKEAMYAIATDKAKKVAETIAKKIKEGDSRTLETLEQDIKMVANDKNPKFADQKDSIIVKLEKIYRKKGGKKSLNDIIKK